MHYIFFALLVLSAAYALFELLTILRVATGKARFTDNGAVLFHFSGLVISATLALWSFSQAFPA